MLTIENHKRAPVSGDVVDNNQIASGQLGARTDPRNHSASEYQPQRIGQESLSGDSNALLQSSADPAQRALPPFLGGLAEISDQVMIDQALEAPPPSLPPMFPPPLTHGYGEEAELPDNDFSRQDVLNDFPSLDLTDFVFLEDALLPDLVDYSIFSPFLAPSDVGSSATAIPPATADILDCRTRHVTPTPSPNDAPEGRPDYQGAHHVLRPIRCRDEDANVVQGAFQKASSLAPDLGTSSLTRSRTSRLLNAYFQYFDPHTPIVHRPSFEISSTPGKLCCARIPFGCIH